MNDMIPRRLRTRARFWKDCLTEWQVSGLSQIEYCEEKGLSIRTFSSWKRKGVENIDIGSPKKVKESSIRLVELPLENLTDTSVLPSTKPLRLVVRGKYRIELEQDFDTELLNRLLGILERR
jgi:hypothetical protein